MAEDDRRSPVLGSIARRREDRTPARIVSQGNGACCALVLAALLEPVHLDRPIHSLDLLRTTALEGGAATLGEVDGDRGGEDLRPAGERESGA
jgi:hypothetical protein